MDAFSINFFLILCLTAIVGWITRYSFTSYELKPLSPFTKENIFDTVEECFLIFLSGVSAISITLFVSALLGLFNKAFFTTVFIFLLAFYFFKRRTYKKTTCYFPLYLLFIFLFWSVNCFTGLFIKPQAALLNSTDASIYLGTAFNLSNRGNIRHYDEFVSEMNIDEREAFFKNRFPNDDTGKYARFPGGVPLVDISTGTVSFRFSPMLPLWLGFGLEFLGERDFLNLLILFSSISLISLFLMARQLGGVFTGFSLAFIYISFFPQLYYSSFPSSELLTQTLFLSGLWVFIFTFFKGESAPLGNVRLASTLWGVMFFCRIDSLMFLSLSLILIFLCSPNYRERLSEQRYTFVSWLFFFLLAAFFYQFTGGTYQNVISRFLHLDSFVLERINGFLNNKYHFVLTILIAISAVMSLLLNKLLNRQWRRSLRLAGKAFLVFVTMAGVGFFVLRLNHGKFSRSIQWITLYIPEGLLLLLLPGVFFLLFLIKDKIKKTAALMVFLFFLVPAFCYLTDPLVTPMQPWAVRRFVPVIFPLFFLITISGWYILISLIFNKFAGKYKKLFTPFLSLLISLLIILFWNKSFFFLEKPHFENIVTKIEKIVSTFPKKESLVIIPDSQAGMHLQIPLQYMSGLDTLLLPLGSELTDERVNKKAVVTFLKRQLDQGRRVFLILDRKSRRFSYPARAFGLTFLAEKSISFSYLPQVSHYLFPNRTEEFSVNYIIFEFQNREDLQVNDFRVDIGVLWEDIPFVLNGFYGPESEPPPSNKTFRWTGPDARLMIPPVKSIQLLINPWRPQDAVPLDLVAETDGIITSRFNSVLSDQRNLCINIPDDMYEKGKWMELTLKSTPFSPQKLGLSDDIRELGVVVYSIEAGCH